jgi:DNA-binding transcriptional MerR regulator
MTQLDLFSLSTVPKKPENEPVRNKEEGEEKKEADAVENLSSIVAIAEEVFTKADEESTPIMEVDVTLPVANTSASEVPSARTGDIIFEDSKISVKIKARQAPAKKEEPQPRIEQPKEKRGLEYPLPGNVPKVEVKKSIVTKQPKTDYSNALNEKLNQLKSNIKEALLKENISASKKRDKEVKPPQKRGRKSYKEVDDELDLVDIPDDEILFKKQYYAISEVAGWFNVNTSLLRFWENEFDILKPRKNRKGDRLFRPEDVKNLQIIYQLLRQRKYSIEGAKEYLKVNKDKADTQLQLTTTLQKFKSFLLELKANLQQG